MNLIDLLHEALKLEQSAHPVLVAIAAKVEVLPDNPSTSPSRTAQLEDAAAKLIPVALQFLPAGSAAAAIISAAPEIGSGLLLVEQICAPLFRTVETAIGDAVANSRPVQPDNGTDYPVPPVA